MTNTDAQLPHISLDEDITPTVVDPRHQHRVELMQSLFSYSFADSHPDFNSQISPELQPLLAKLSEIDAILTTNAPERPLSEINKIDLAILRLIVFESTEKKTPRKVLIDEAVELAKEFGTESSPKFVNGVLAHILLPEVPLEK